MKLLRLIVDKIETGKDVAMTISILINPSRAIHNRSPSDSFLADALLQAGENCLKCLRKSEHSKEQFSFVTSLLLASTNLLKMLRNSFAGNMMVDTNSKR